MTEQQWRAKIEKLQGILKTKTMVNRFLCKAIGRQARQIEKLRAENHDLRQRLMTED